MRTLKLFIILSAAVMFIPAVSYAADVCTQEWVTGPDMPTARYRMHGAVADGEFFVIGGYNDQGAGPVDANESYDPWTDSWTVNAPLPAPLTNACVVELNGAIHVLGGTGASEVVLDTHYVYDPAGDAWTTAAPLPGPAYATYCGAWDGKIYMAGGIDGTYSVTAAMNIYDSGLDTWSSGPDMPAAVWGGEGVILQGIFYALGGFQALTSMYLYDIAGDSWSTSISVLPDGRQTTATAGVTTIIGTDLIFMMGGSGGGTGWGVYDTFWEYVNSGWANLTGTNPLPEAVGSQAGGNVGGSLVYSAGGHYPVGSNPLGSNSFYSFKICIPFLRSADPAFAVEGQETVLDIIGLAFDDSAAFWLDDGAKAIYPLTNTVIDSENEAHATVPATVPAGEYELWVSTAWSIVVPDFFWKIPFSIVTTTTTTTTTTTEPTTTTTEPTTTTTEPTTTTTEPTTTTTEPTTTTTEPTTTTIEPTTTSTTTTTGGGDDDTGDDDVDDTTTDDTTTDDTTADDTTTDDTTADDTTADDTSTDDTAADDTAADDTMIDDTGDDTVNAPAGGAEDNGGGGNCCGC